MTAEQLDIGLEVPPPAEHLSADRRRTLRQHVDVERGIHPLTRGKARPDLGTCGDCVHRLASERRYPKCELGPVTRGAQTDVRAWWPACGRFTARPA